MIVGYELKRQVIDHLAALEHEKRGAMSARQLESIEAQHPRGHPAAGTAAFYHRTDRG